MGMKMSLQEFNNTLLSELCTLHWRQWAALGIAANIDHEKNEVIDIEALIASTFAIRNLDIRLFEGMLEWIFINKEFIFTTRLIRIIGEYSKQDIGPNIRLIDENEANIFKRIIKYRHSYEQMREIIQSELNTDKNGAFTNRENTFELRNIVTKPAYSDVSVLHLLLRSFSGTDTRADVLMYMLLNEEGNSYSIAKEIYHDQKNVYRILEQWTSAGIVNKIDGPKKNRYSINRKEDWLSALSRFGTKDVIRQINWVSVFLLYATIAKALVSAPWGNDDYLMTSLLYDLENKIKIVEAMNIKSCNSLQECVNRFRHTQHTGIA
jgi:hypothetical protein